MRSIFEKLKKAPGLGLELKPGDKHYRAYVGPPKDYDLISAMVFNLLTCIGLRQHHRVLDVGCGSLRVGRLLIPYLNATNYNGVEPNKWLVKDGVRNEIGNDLIELKKPQFIYERSLELYKNKLGIDFAFAQSIFSHCGLDLITHWLSQVAYHLNEDGAFLATFLIDQKDYEGKGWVYPGCVSYKVETLKQEAEKHNLKFCVLDWGHPRQTWALFSKEHFDDSLVANGPISWNRFVEKNQEVSV